MLLALGADPNNWRGRHNAACRCCVEGDLNGFARYLRTARGQTPVSQAGTQPIHDAALGGFAEVIRELATHGADVNARTRDEGQTPLHTAAVMGKMKAVETLVALGADLTIKDSRGRTPLEAAERAGLTDVVAFLRRAAAAR